MKTTLLTLLLLASPAVFADGAHTAQFEYTLGPVTIDGQTTNGGFITVDGVDYDPAKGLEILVEPDTGRLFAYDPATKLRSAPFAQLPSGQMNHFGEIIPIEFLPGIAPEISAPVARSYWTCVDGPFSLHWQQILESDVTLKLQNDDLNLEFHGATNRQLGGMRHAWFGCKTGERKSG